MPFEHLVRIKNHIFLNLTPVFLFAVHINEASMAIILAIVFGVVGFIVIVFIVFAVVKKKCGPQIQFYAQSRMGRLPKQGQ